MWSVKPSEYVQGGNIFELVAIKAATRDGKAPLDGGAVTDARVSYSGQGVNKGNPTVSMSMNAEGASIWARLTKDNIGNRSPSFLTTSYILILMSILRLPAVTLRFQDTSE